MESSWVDPEAVQSDGRLHPHQIDSWREHGFALVEGLIPDSILRASQKQFQDHIGDGAALRERRDFGGLEFPFNESVKALNDLTLHPNVLTCVSDLLGCSGEDIRLTQSDAWAKFSSPSSEARDAYDNQDQRIHIDGWNHMLVCPPPWDHPVSVAMIVYLSDHSETGGATALVPRKGNQQHDEAYDVTAANQQTPGCGEIPWINDKNTAEQFLKEKYPDVARFRQELYAREKKARFRFGTVLLYRHDLWHRGTPLDRTKKAGVIRLVVNLSFRRADADWFNHWNAGWAKSMYGKEQTLEKLVATATVAQRNFLGFPKPGHSYWTKETLEAVTKRYACFGFDPEPYKLK